MIGEQANKFGKLEQRTDLEKAFTFTGIVAGFTSVFSLFPSIDPALQWKLSQAAAVLWLAFFFTTTSLSLDCRKLALAGSVVFFSSSIYALETGILDAKLGLATVSFALALAMNSITPAKNVRLIISACFSSLSVASVVWTVFGAGRSGATPWAFIILLGLAGLILDCHIRETIKKSKIPNLTLLLPISLSTTLLCIAIASEAFFDFKRHNPGSPQIPFPIFVPALLAFFVGCVLSYTVLLGKKLTETEDLVRELSSATQSSKVFESGIDAIVNALSEMVIYFNGQEEIEFFNRACASKTHRIGSASEEALFLRDFFSHESLLTLRREGFPEARKKGHWRKSLRLLSSKGYEFSVEVTLLARFNFERTVIGYTAICLDTQQVKNGEENKNSQLDLLHSLIANLPLPGWISLDSRTRTCVNQAYLEMIGVAKEQVCSGEFLRFIHLQDHTTVVQGIEHASKKKTVATVEYRLKHSDETYHTVKEWIVPFDDWSGQQRLIGLTLDLNEMMIVEEQAAFWRQVVDLVFKHLHGAFWVEDLTSQSVVFSRISPGISVALSAEELAGEASAWKNAVHRDPAGNQILSTRESELLHEVVFEYKRRVSKERTITVEHSIIPLFKKSSNQHGPRAVMHLLQPVEQEKPSFHPILQSSIDGELSFLLKIFGDEVFERARALVSVSQLLREEDLRELPRQAVSDVRSLVSKAGELADSLRPVAEIGRIMKKKQIPEILELEKFIRPRQEYFQVLQNGKLFIDKQLFAILMDGLRGVAPGKKQIEISVESNHALKISLKGIEHSNESLKNLFVPEWNTRGQSLWQSRMVARMLGGDLILEGNSEGNLHLSLPLPGITPMRDDSFSDEEGLGGLGKGG